MHDITFKIMKGEATTTFMGDSFYASTILNGLAWMPKSTHYRSKSQVLHRQFIGVKLNYVYDCGNDNVIYDVPVLYSCMQFLYL